MNRMYEERRKEFWKNMMVQHARQFEAMAIDKLKEEVYAHKK